MFGGKPANAVCKDLRSCLTWVIEENRFRPDGNCFLTIGRENLDLQKKADRTTPSLQGPILGATSSNVASLCLLELSQRLSGHSGHLPDYNPGWPSLLIGLFGASAVLLFWCNRPPLAQPRNLIGGHLVSAAVAVTMVELLGSTPLAMAFGVGLAIFVMNLTHTTHPPGGATA